MKLLLNELLVEVSEAADTMVLDFVRARGLTGTKEGCASGDCGACTVMIGESIKGETRYRSANACILPLGQLAGKHLITIEGLAQNGMLHPAQEAMVDCHASQCGYCTPGFVMSLATLVENGAGQDREDILQGISGNLCRCTGYKPIVDAGLQALSQTHNSELGNMPLPDAGDEVSVFRPADESELRRDMAARPEARLIAGGTDLMLEVTQSYHSIDCLIDLSGVLELGQIDIDESEIVIGAAVPYSNLETVLAPLSTPLQKLLLRLGSRQIRNSGTVGGNLANGSPIADMPPVLMALDAEIELVSIDGAGRRLTVADFYIGYRQTVLLDEEYLARIRIKREVLGCFHRFYKSSKRIEDDISSVMGAFRLTGDSSCVDQVRIAFGGMAATPVRLQAVEQAIAGQALTDELIEFVCRMLDDEMTPLTDVRASATYRSAMAKSMLERALREFRGENLALVSELEIHA